MQNSPEIYLITGAASGIGRATAALLSRPGRRLILHTRGNRAGLEQVASAARAAGTEVDCQFGDLAEEAQCQALAAHILDSYPHLNGMVTAAGFADRSPLAELDRQRLIHSWAPITAAFNALLRDLRPALARVEGNVVAVSSFVAHRFIGKTMPASAAAKAGLEALVKAFATELALEGININAVVPGFIEKDPGAHRAVSAGGYDAAKAGIPKGRLGTPEDVAAAIGFLISPQADYITGQLLHVDGGLTL